MTDHRPATKLTQVIRDQQDRDMEAHAERVIAFLIVGLLGVCIGVLVTVLALGVQL